MTRQHNYNLYKRLDSVSGQLNDIAHELGQMAMVTGTDEMLRSMALNSAALIRALAFGLSTAGRLMAADAGTIAGIYETLINPPRRGRVWNFGPFRCDETTK